MRRRFGRGRKKTTGSRDTAIDAARVFGRIAEERIGGVTSLETVNHDEMPESFAAVGTGEVEGGGRVVVGFSPRDGGNAALAALAHAQTLGGDEPFDGEVLAICPQWTGAARRRLGFFGSTPFGFRALTASALGDDPGVEAEPAAPIWVPARRVADRLTAAADREVFVRALAALEGLAAKHGGSVRGTGTSAELVLLAQRVAAIRAESGGVVLETLLAERTTDRLDGEGLATALDRLEGSLRRRLNDRRARSSEEGLRSQLWRPMAALEQLRRPILWPLSGFDPEPLDLVGTSSDGTPVIAALRGEISLAALGSILDAVAAVEPSLPALLEGAEAPARLDGVRLALGARSYDGLVLGLLPLLSLDHRVYDIQVRRGRGPELSLRESGAAAPTRGVAEERTAPTESAEEGGSATGERPSRRRRGRRGSRSGPSEAREARGDDAGESRFDEVSLFDLDDGSDDDSDSESSSRRSRRGRGRRRGGRRRTGGEDAGAGEEATSSVDAPDVEEAAESEEPRSRRGRGRGRKKGSERARLDQNEPADTGIEDDDSDDDSDDDIADAMIVVADVPEPEIGADSDYDDSDGDDDVTTDVETEPEIEEESTPEGITEMRRRRRRAAIVVHADRGSVIAGVLLARDIRLLEGFWVYGQEDLMTFFRSVATDLRDTTPIYLVGFTASPARDAIQAASLYVNRLAWFDHHDWPPEDLDSLCEAVGAQFVNVTPGTESPIPAVLSERTRRSRFSDKIVELATGRFSQHDYERWGRVWWQRLGDVAQRPGERRSDVDSLLVGRPSDLAREAADVPKPDPPTEVAYVSGHDFRLVHFGGYRMVVVPTPPEFDVHLCARIARERYDATISLAFTEGSELLILSGDEGRGRRTLDLTGMAGHLASKHDWLSATPSEDHVARVRIDDLATHPDRLDEVIGEIAMGRSILEG